MHRSDRSRLLDRWLAPRRAFGIAAMICFSLIAFALYLQHVQHEDPCPLCVFQRVAVIALGVVFLVAALHAPGRLGLRLYSSLLVLISLIGGCIATRHVWLQLLPKDRVPECGPGLDFMIEQFPLAEVLALVFRGSGECAEAGWRFLGLTIPMWTLMWFIAFAALAIVVGWRARRQGLAASFTR